MESNLVFREPPLEDVILKMLPHDSGEAGERSETDDQQDVGSACERQDGKRVVGGAMHSIA